MDKNDPLWNLLGKAPLLEPDAWFATRTVARLRRESRPSLWQRCRPVLIWAGATVIIVAFTLQFSAPELKPGHDTAKIQDALNYIADRGTETDLWLESSTL